MQLRRVAIGLALAFALLACGEDGPGRRDGSGRPRESDPGPYVPEVDDGLGAAIMLVIDTSGSMNDQVPGGRRAKSEVAREAIGKMLDATERFAEEHPQHRIRVGVMSFSDRPDRVLSISDYDKAKVLAALAKVSRPGGGTAIGDALQAARKELYRSGCIRKYILTVTDGENTAGAAPEPVAREIHRRSEGGVRVYFVAFDTDPAKFAFLKEVGGDVVQAGSEEQLQAALNEIYEGRILAEAMTDVESPVEDR